MVPNKRVGGIAHPKIYNLLGFFIRRRKTFIIDFLQNSGFLVVENISNTNNLEIKF